ncbi:MAG: PEGA domain-containing protein [Acidobacteria bacterium]|nr:PEGA domain-containing protein [Acidobacteriota bacterium]
MRVVVALVAVVGVLAQDARPPVLATAVSTLAERHTSRWTAGDPLANIAGSCQTASAVPPYAVTCAAANPREPRAGRRYFYSVVLFRDLEETLYLAACAATVRDSFCGDLQAGQTLPAEVEGDTIRVVIRDEQLPLRILERRPKPTTIDSPTPGTPSNARPSAGTPSAVPYSKVAESRGAPSQVRPSEVSVAAGAPSLAPPSEVSVAAASPASARLFLYCSVGSALVYVDNQQFGSPPVDVPLLPGRHTIEVRARGFRRWTRTVNIPAGGVVKVTAELRR